MLSIPRIELLMFATPHHQERLRPIVSSSNAVQFVGCTPTIHGQACPVLGAQWSLVEHLHRTSFHSTESPRLEMLPDIRSALEVDLDYRVPDNYMRGAGDTYFAGKMLAKLARILIVADELGGVDQVKFDSALGRLRAGVEVWLNGSAESPLLYDSKWGGVVMCGCIYNGHGCDNAFPDCPAIVDAGSNFGAGFYNDHHYHFGVFSQSPRSLPPAVDLCPLLRHSPLPPSHALTRSPPPPSLSLSLSLQAITSTPRPSCPSSTRSGAAPFMNTCCC